MSDFDNQLYFKAIYEYKEEDLITYLEENRSSLPKDRLEQLVSTIMQNKKWEAFDYCVEKDLIHTDLFEYDSFKDPVINAILIQTKYFKQEDLESFMPHFTQYLNKLDDINETLASENMLSFALNEGLPIPILSAILDNGIKTDFVSKSDQNYLHMACDQKQNISNYITLVNNEGSLYISNTYGPNTNYRNDVIGLLINLGIDINAKDAGGSSPLALALENYNAAKVPTIQLLLDNGADVNSEDKRGITPLYITVVNQQNLSLSQLLLQFGTPDFDKLNLDGENLLNAYLRMMSRTSSSADMLLLLLDNGASLNATSQYYSKDKSGIDWIAEKSSELMKVLLDKGLIDVDAVDNDGQTILMKVCQIDPNYEESVAKDLYRKVKYLLKAGADPNVEDRFDKKAVDYAMDNNMKIKIVETLLEN